MARTSYVTVTGATAELYYSILRIGDRFTFSKMSRKSTLYSRKRKNGVTARSLLPEITAAWNALSSLEQEAWSDAGAEMSLTGFRLFVQDKTARILNDLAGNATPSLLHQSWVGALLVSAPATKIKIGQYHPRSYWVSHKVYGKKGMYEPVLVTEDFALPLTISLNYKSNLSSVGGNSFSKFYATIWHSYQGQDIFTDLVIDLDFVTGWKHAEITLSSLIGYVVGYNLFFEINDLQGILHCDNIKAVHSGQNWCRDPWCKDINQGFTRAFYQIPKHWVALELPDGAEYNSIYVDS